MENGKWGKTAIKKVAAPAYASSLRCRILKCPCELSTGFSPHNPAKKPVRRGGRRKRLSLAAWSWCWWCWWWRWCFYVLLNYPRNGPSNALWGCCYYSRCCCCCCHWDCTFISARSGFVVLQFRFKHPISNLNESPSFFLLSPSFVVSFGDFMQRLPFVVYHLPLHIVVTS